MLYSKRFISKSRELGNQKRMPDWMVFACWIANNRHFQTPIILHKYVAGD